MDKIVSSLLFSVAIKMYGFSKIYRLQLKVEIIDVLCFTLHEVLNAFAIVCLGKGKRIVKSVYASKCRSARLHRVLFHIITTLLQEMLKDNSVCQFLDMKRTEGKSYRVC